MKTSNKILLIAVLGVFVAIMLVGIGIRVYKPVAAKIEIIELDTKDTNVSEKIVTQDKADSKKVAKRSASTNDEISVTNKKIAVRDFNSLVIKGSWDVKIKRGDQYEVNLNIPPKWMKKVQVAKNAKTLYLLFDKDSRERVHLSAEITMPTLKKIKSVGGNTIDFSGIDTSVLAIETAGASDIQGKDNQIANLWIVTLGATEITLDKSTIGNVNIKTSGASQIDLNNSVVTNAQVNLQGTSEVQLNMLGGKLTGQVAGMSSIVYRGKVSEQTIKTAGMSRVERK